MAPRILKSQSGAAREWLHRAMIEGEATSRERPRSTGLPVEIVLAADAIALRRLTEFTPADHHQGYNSECESRRVADRIRL